MNQWLTSGESDELPNPVPRLGNTNEILYPTTLVLLRHRLIPRGFHSLAHPVRPLRRTRDQDRYPV